jgi:rod shape determining protein RodA
MSFRKTLYQLDFLLIATSLLLVMAGLLAAYSLSLGGTDSTLYLKQLSRIGIACCLCLIFLYIDFEILTYYSVVFYVILLLMLLGVLFFGTEINGSKSWLAFGSIRLQPSEPGKIVFILFMASLLGQFKKEYLPISRLIKCTALGLLPVILILLQGDLGTAVMYLPILGGMLWMSGIRPKVLIIILLCLLLVAPVGWLVLKDYQKLRIKTVFNPDLDPQGIGYQTRQSLIAMGSGGFFGKGIGKGLQSQLGYVPESHTDFIFTLLVEETGFIGAFIVLTLYLIILWRMLEISRNARNRGALLITTGVICFFLSHLVINIGMATGLLPAIGIPLPLLSYGGSSLLASSAALGLALNINLRRFANT